MHGSFEGFFAANNQKSKKKMIKKAFSFGGKDGLKYKILSPCLQSQSTQKLNEITIKWA